MCIVIQCLPTNSILNDCKRATCTDKTPKAGPSNENKDSSCGKRDLSSSTKPMDRGLCLFRQTKIGKKERLYNVKVSHGKFTTWTQNFTTSRCPPSIT